MSDDAHSENYYSDEPEHLSAEAAAISEAEPAEQAPPQPLSCPPVMPPPTVNVPGTVTPELSTEIESFLTCPLSQDLFNDPVVLVSRERHPAFTKCRCYRSESVLI